MLCKNGFGLGMFGQENVSRRIGGSITQRRLFSLFYEWSSTRCAGSYLNARRADSTCKWKTIPSSKWTRQISTGKISTGTYMRLKRREMLLMRTIEEHGIGLDMETRRLLAIEEGKKIEGRNATDAVSDGVLPDDQIPLDAKATSRRAYSTPRLGSRSTSRRVYSTPRLDSESTSGRVHSTPRLGSRFTSRLVYSTPRLGSESTTRLGSESTSKLVYVYSTPRLGSESRSRRGIESTSRLVCSTPRLGSRSTPYSENDKQSKGTDRTKASNQDTLPPTATKKSQYASKAISLHHDDSILPSQANPPKPLSSTSEYFRRQSKGTDRTKASNQDTLTPTATKKSQYTSKAISLHHDDSILPSQANPPKPLSPTSEYFRKTMRNMPHSVVVITSLLPDNAQSPATISTGYRGMTVSSFTTLSLRGSRPIVTFNIKSPSGTLDAIRATGTFFVHMLEATASGARVANAFTTGTQGNKFANAGVTLGGSKDGISPIMRGEGIKTVLVFKLVKCVDLDGHSDCDHVIVVGESKAKLPKNSKLGDRREKYHGLCYMHGRYMTLGSAIELENERPMDSGKRVGDAEQPENRSWLSRWFKRA